MKRSSAINSCAKWAFLAITFVSFPSISGEPIKVCSLAEAKAAEAIAASISSWEKLYFVFQKYGHCDDGAIGEGFSESISVLLAEKWGTVDLLAQLVKKNSAFREFVIRHLDETVPAARLEKVKLNAWSNCSKAAQDICHEIYQSFKK